MRYSRRQFAGDSAEKAQRRRSSWRFDAAGSPFGPPSLVVSPALLQNDEQNRPDERDA